MAKHHLQNKTQLWIYFNVSTVLNGQSYPKMRADRRTGLFFDIIALEKANFHVEPESCRHGN